MNRKNISFSTLGRALLILGLVLNISCNKNNSFLSAKKLKDLIVGKWVLQPLLEGEAKEKWEFRADGAVIRLDPTGLLLDKGAYEIHPRLLNSKMSIAGMRFERYNGKWFIVNVNKSVLQINNNEPCPEGVKHCGTFEREFYRN